MQKIKIWSVPEDDEAEQQVQPIKEVHSTEAEKRLENLLVQEPDMLMPGLELVGRQTPTAGGPLDLLGVDDEGRLVVFELKRETLHRQAVAQIVEYASRLNSMSPDALGEHIAERSGRGGIQDIENFAEWYEENFSPEEVDYTDPPRLVLVGLGADEATRSMVAYLSEVGVDIMLITFYGFERDGELLLARQVEVERTVPPKGGAAGRSEAERREALEQRAQDCDTAEELEDCRSLVEETMPKAYTQPLMSKYSFLLNHLSEAGNTTSRKYLGIRPISKGPSLQLEIPERAHRVAPKQVESVMEKCSAELGKGGDYVRMRIGTREEWPRLRAAIGDLFEAIYAGWEERRRGEQRNTQRDDETNSMEE